MNLYTLISIILVWAIGLAFAYKFAEIGYPWLAIVVLLILGSIRVKWGEEKETEEE